MILVSATILAMEKTNACGCGTLCDCTSHVEGVTDEFDSRKKMTTSTTPTAHSQSNYLYTITEGEESKDESDRDLDSWKNRSRVNTTGKLSSMELSRLSPPLFPLDHDSPSAPPVAIAPDPRLPSRNLVTKSSS